MFWKVAPTIVATLFTTTPQSHRHNSRYITHRHHSSPTSTEPPPPSSSSSSSSSSPSPNDTDETTARRYTSLLKWLRANGAEINSKLEIRPSGQRGSGYGAFVSSDVGANELLFTVPRRACLTLDDAINDAQCGEAFQRLMARAGPGGNTVVMAGYMAKEYLIMLEGIINGGENDDDVGMTPWAPYFEVLPWERGVNSQEHILFWSDDLIESLLKGSLCYNEAISLRSEVNLATRVISQIVGPSIRQARGEQVTNQAAGGFTWPWEAKPPPPPQQPPDGLSEAIAGAFVCLLTRSFQDSREMEGGDEPEKLVPLLDMLQHSAEPNVRHAMRSVDGTVEVRARCDIEANSELFNQYRSEGEESSMPYYRFFTRFGFVPGIDESVEILLKDKNGIFYPQKAEV